MITQEFIYKAAQSAFATAHPKFPWPKKHDLEDQSDEFKRAFLILCADINAEHERHTTPLRESKAGYRDAAVKADAEVDRLEAKLSSKGRKLAFAWLIIGVLIGGAAVWYMNQTPTCLEESKLQRGDMYMSYNDVYVGFKEVGGKTVAIPFCTK